MTASGKISRIACRRSCACCSALPCRFMRCRPATLMSTASLIALSAHATRCAPCICSANSAMRRRSSSGSPKRPPKGSSEDMPPSLDSGLGRALAGGRLLRAILAAEGDHLLEAAHAEDEHERGKADSERQHPDRDLLTHRVGGDRGLVGGPGEDADEQRLRHAGAL